MQRIIKVDIHSAKSSMLACWSSNARNSSKTKTENIIFNMQKQTSEDDCRNFEKVQREIPAMEYFFLKKKERISSDFFKGFFLGHFHSFYYPRETSPENWRKEQRKTIIYDKFLSCASKTLKQLESIEKRFSNFISLSWRRSLSYRNQSIDSKIDRYAAVFSSQLQARRKWHSTMIDN